MRIALFGGTFNPPHHGHVHVADLLSKRFDEVWLVVANDPNKKEKPFIQPRHRLAMAQLAVQGMRNVNVSDVEIRRGGTSFTADTLEELSKDHPQHEFTWVIGADLLSDVFRWKDSDALLRTRAFAVVSRPGYAINQDTLTRFAHSQTIHDESGVDASSTQIRQWIHASQFKDAEKKLPEKVANYIRKNKLYA